MAITSPGISIDASRLETALKAMVGRRASVDRVTQARIDDFIDHIAADDERAAVTWWDVTDSANPVLRWDPSPALRDFVSDLESSNRGKQ